MFLWYIEKVLIVSLYTCYLLTIKDKVVDYISIYRKISFYSANIIKSGHYDSNITTPQPKWGA
jgi:hypothetical protein